MACAHVHGPDTISLSPVRIRAGGPAGVNIASKHRYVLAHFLIARINGTAVTWSSQDHLRSYARVISYSGGSRGTKDWGMMMRIMQWPGTAENQWEY